MGKMTKSPTKLLYLASKTFNNFLIPSLQVCQNPRKLLQTPANFVQLCPFGNFFSAQRNFMSQRKSGKATIRFFLKYSSLKKFHDMKLVGLTLDLFQKTKKKIAER